MPPEIGQLTALKELDLRGNRLTALPPEIGQLTALKWLGLKGNHLTALPAEIGQLTALEALDLIGNRLTALPPEIGQLTALKELDLIGNQFTALPAEIGQLTALKGLYLDDNQLTALPPEIGQLTALKGLYLRGNRLTALPAEIGQLTVLKRLDLSSNRLTALPPEIGQLTVLKELDLRGNRLTALPNTLLELPSTCRVYLANNPLSQRILDNLRAATQASDYRGPFIHFSVHEERAEDSRTATEIYGDICKLAEKIPVTLKALLEKEDTLRSWLSRLSYIGDFKHSSPKQKALAEAIADYIEKAENEPEFRDSFFSVIEGAGATCGDRMALSLLYLDINFQISESLKKSDLEKLAYLILHGTYALDQLQAAAAEKAKTLRFVDEIEIYLAYPIKLKESLQLPIVLDTMLYFSCSGVEEKDLKAAKELVLDTLSNKEACYGKLVESETWERTLKDCKAKEYERLEEVRDDLSEREKYAEAQEGFKAGLLDLTKSVLGSWRPPLCKSGKEES